MQKWPEAHDFTATSPTARLAHPLAGEAAQERQRRRSVPQPQVRFAHQPRMKPQRRPLVPRRVLLEDQQRELEPLRKPDVLELLRWQPERGGCAGE